MPDAQTMTQSPMSLIEQNGMSFNFTGKRISYSVQDPWRTSRAHSGFHQYSSEDFQAFPSDLMLTTLQKLSLPPYLYEIAFRHLTRSCSTVMGGQPRSPIQMGGGELERYYLPVGLRRTNGWSSDSDPRFNDSPRNLMCRTAVGTSWSWSKERSRTLGSETFNSRGGGVWSR
jgi:hypothetical protein